MVEHIRLKQEVVNGDSDGADMILVGKVLQEILKHYEKLISFYDDTLYTGEKVRVANIYITNWEELLKTREIETKNLQYEYRGLM